MKKIKLSDLKRIEKILDILESFISDNGKDITNENGALLPIDESQKDKEWSENVYILTSEGLKPIYYRGKYFPKEESVIEKVASKFVLKVGFGDPAIDFMQIRGENKFITISQVHEVIDFNK